MGVYIPPNIWYIAKLTYYNLVAGVPKEGDGGIYVYIPPNIWYIAKLTYYNLVAGMPKEGGWGYIYPPIFGTSQS